MGGAVLALGLVQS